jgi:PIN domain nuclease of toxin-antitoxin system
MNTLTFTKAQNTNFAISAVDIREVIADLGDKTLQTFAQITGKHERSLSRTAHENTDSAHRTKLLAALRTEVETRLKSIKDLESEIDYDLNQLKTAILSLDTRNETAFRNLVREKADKINSLVQLPLQSIVPLDPSKTRTGEIGVFTRPIEISQVVSKEEGRALCYSSHTQRASLTARSGPFFISNVDLTNFVDGNWFAPSSDLIFQTVGTRTYTTVAGSPKTVFEFSCIVNLRNEAVLEPLRSYKLTKSLEPIISGDEKRLIETRKREFADIQAQERANLAAKQKQEKRQAESKAKLSGAKQFLNQGKTDLAKKWLQKIVDDFADLPEAKEAQELLNKL